MGTPLSLTPRGGILTDAHKLPSKSLSSGEKNPYLVAPYSDRSRGSGATPITANHSKYYNTQRTSLLQTTSSMLPPHRTYQNETCNYH
jgi:hypothetical protein